jgi:hypothetical protein
MLKVYIGNSFEPQEVIVSSESTVTEIYEENGIVIPTGSIVTVGSRRLGDSELDKPLRELGVAEGAIITFSQKLNGAK